MFDEKFVTFFNTPGLLSLVGVPIVVDKADFPAIHIAAQNLAADFAKVTKGSPSPLQHVTEERDGFELDAEACIIVGCIKASPIIRYLDKSGKLDCGNLTRPPSLTTLSMGVTRPSSLREVTREAQLLGRMHSRRRLEFRRMTSPQ
jgi:hypothetical protein